MSLYSSLAMAALAGILVLSANAAERVNAGATGAGGGVSAASASRVPSVAEPSEPVDSVLVSLPGPRAKPGIQLSNPEPKLEAPSVPPKTAGPKPSPVPSAVAKAVREAPRKTSPSPSAPVFPPDFQKDSALFCQQRIGQWSKADAYNLLGDPLRERPAYSEAKTENGRIYAFRDPTGRYRALELDFAADKGLLRTVFVYPWGMTWLECRHLWGAKVTSTGTNNGKTFYSYLDHRLDVLVDPRGKVVSLGFY
jgi:hypothetical protein